MRMPVYCENSAQTLAAVSGTTVLTGLPKSGPNMATTWPLTFVAILKSKARQLSPRLERQRTFHRVMLRENLLFGCRFRVRRIAALLITGGLTTGILRACKHAVCLPGWRLNPWLGGGAKVWVTVTRQSRWFCTQFVLTG